MKRFSLLITLVMTAILFATMLSGPTSAQAIQHVSFLKAKDCGIVGLKTGYLGDPNNHDAEVNAYKDTCTGRAYTEVINNFFSTNPYTAACISNGHDASSPQCNASTSTNVVDSPEVAYYPGSMASCGGVGQSAQNNENGCVIY